jgi:PPM family protein phosphatase
MGRMEKIALKGYGCTDIGNNRLINEDYYEINNQFFILADGMGGHNAGEIASQLAVHTIGNYLKKKEIPMINNEDEIEKTLEHAINAANEEIFHLSEQYIEYRGMGTTVVIAHFHEPNKLFIANVGDSSAYILKNNKMTLLSEEHSITAAMIRDGTISKSEAKTHPYRHHITRSVGTSIDVKPYINSYKINQIDLLLLCSDGLTDVLTINEIKDVLQQQKDPQLKCENLIKKVKMKKGNDNITVIIGHLEEKKFA